MSNTHLQTRPALSVVVPFYNEQDNVAALLAEIDAALAPALDYEMIAVDDGSTDATPAALAKAATRFERLRVVRMTANRGQSAALVNGIHAARAALIATLDGDGQNPPADILTLVRSYRQAEGPGPVAVVGWRRQRNDSRLRRLSSRLANRFRSTILADHCPDTGCGLKVFARRDFLALPRFRHMHRFIPALLARAGVDVISVPVAHRARRSGQSKYGVRNRLWTGLIDTLGVYWLIHRGCRIEAEAHDV